MRKIAFTLVVGMLVTACTVPSVNSRGAFLHNPQLREAARIGADIPGDGSSLTAGQIALIRHVIVSEDNNLRRKQRVQAIIDR